MSDFQKPARGASGGQVPRETRGSYTYKDGDWTYEELAKLRLDAQRKYAELCAALGFKQNWMHPHEKIVARARWRRWFPWWGGAAQPQKEKLDE